jgi:hypothetical protein
LVNSSKKQKMPYGGWEKRMRDEIGAKTVSRLANSVDPWSTNKSLTTGPSS